MNGILLIDKPKDMTSFDVIAQLRKALKIRKIGHTGTLDPQATGLLQILVGSATKLTPFLESHDKEYLATYQYGYKSDTYDIWGNIEKVDYRTPTSDQVLNALNQLTGKITQLPPMYSAIKVKGKKLYEYARKQEDVDIPTREVEVYTHELLREDEDHIDVRVHCSKGTYIRSLAHDFGELIQVPTVVSSLRRTKVGNCSVEDAYSLEEVLSLGEKVSFLDPKDLLSEYTFVEYEDLGTIVQGKKISLDCDEEVVMITNNGMIVAAYEKDQDGLYRCKRGLL